MDCGLQTNKAISITGCIVHQDATTEMRLRGAFNGFRGFYGHPGPFAVFPPPLARRSAFRTLFSVGRRTGVKSQPQREVGKARYSVLVRVRQNTANKPLHLASLCCHCCVSPPLVPIHPLKNTSKN